MARRTKKTSIRKILDKRAKDVEFDFLPYLSKKYVTVVSISATVDRFALSITC